jgi:hypothetical protein
MTFTVPGKSVSVSRLAGWITYINCSPARTVQPIPVAGPVDAHG